MFLIRLDSKSTILRSNGLIFGKGVVFKTKQIQIYWDKKDGIWWILRRIAIQVVLFIELVVFFLHNMIDNTNKKEICTENFF